MKQNKICIKKSFLVLIITSGFVLSIIFLANLLTNRKLPFSSRASTLQAPSYCDPSRAKTEVPGSSRSVCRPINDSKGRCDSSLQPYPSAEANPCICLTQEQVDTCKKTSTTPAVPITQVPPTVTAILPTAVSVNKYDSLKNDWLVCARYNGNKNACESNKTCIYHFSDFCLPIDLSSIISANNVFNINVIIENCPCRQGYTCEERIEARFAGEVFAEKKCIKNVDFLKKYPNVLLGTSCNKKQDCGDPYTDCLGPKRLDGSDNKYCVVSIPNNIDEKRKFCQQQTLSDCGSVLGAILYLNIIHKDPELNTVINARYPGIFIFNYLNSKISCSIYGASITKCRRCDLTGTDINDVLPVECR